MLLFLSTGSGIGSTHGNMLFHLHVESSISKKHRLVGYLNDYRPATHYGSIEIFRDESDCKDRINNLTILNKVDTPMIKCIFDNLRSRLFLKIAGTACGRGIVLEGRSRIRLGQGVSLADRVRIKSRSLQAQISIGDYTLIREFA